MATRTYNGKYRGTVVNNVDPLQRGRIQVQVTDVMQVLPSTWAEPCLPVAGLQHGVFMIPAVGSGVWVEFERGDIDHPIWTGGYWGSSAEVPALGNLSAGVQSFIIQTQLQNTLMISDVPGPTGGIMLKTTTGAMIKIDDTGITLSNGKGAVITMAGPSITFNGGAMVIT